MILRTTIIGICVSLVVWKMFFVWYHTRWLETPHTISTHIWICDINEDVPSYVDDMTKEFNILSKVWDSIFIESEWWYRRTCYQLYY